MKRLLKSKFFNKNVSITKKFVLLFLFASLIPLTVVEFTNYYHTVSAMEKKIREYALISLAQTAGNIRTELSGYEDLLNQIVYDDNMNDLLRQLNNKNDAVSRNQLQLRLNIFSYSKKLIDSLLIIPESSGYVISIDKTGQDINPKYWSSLGDLKNISLYKRSIEEYSANIWEGSKLLGSYDNTKYYSFFLGRRVINFNSNTPLGVVILSINEKLLSDIYITQNIVDGENPNICFIIDNVGYIISHSDKGMIGKNVSEIFRPDDVKKLIFHWQEEFNSYIDKKKVMIYSKSIPKTDWQIVNVIDRDYLFKEVYYIRNLTLIAGFVALMVMLSISLSISKGIAGPVKSIIHAMRMTQNGELTARAEAGTRDEIGIIASQFNLMMERIVQLIDEVKRVNKKEKEAEIKALEAQINPHFLYNTLDSINWMAIEKEEYDISNSLKQLANILRYSINKSNEIVTISMEIEWMKNYLSLQKNRFSDSFQYNISVDPCLMGCRIRKLLFQPFIENSIIHGFEGKRKDGAVEICIKAVEEARMMFSIKDNGKGMTESKIQKVFYDIEKDKNGIGVNNVLSRLELYYGGDYELSVMSEEGLGTEISINIPRNLGDDYLDENSCS